MPLRCFFLCLCPVLTPPFPSLLSCVGPGNASVATEDPGGTAPTASDCADSGSSVATMSGIVAASRGPGSNASTECGSVVSDLHAAASSGGAPSKGPGSTASTSTGGAESSGLSAADWPDRQTTEEGQDSNASTESVSSSAVGVELAAVAVSASGASEASNVGGSCSINRGMGSSEEVVEPLCPATEVDINRGVLEGPGSIASTNCCSDGSHGSAVATVAGCGTAAGAGADNDASSDSGHGESAGSGSVGLKEKETAGIHADGGEIRCGVRDDSVIGEAGEVGEGEASSIRCVSSSKSGCLSATASAPTLAHPAAVPTATTAASIAESVAVVVQAEASVSSTAAAAAGRLSAVEGIGSENDVREVVVAGTVPSAPASLSASPAVEADGLTGLPGATKPNPTENSLGIPAKHSPPSLARPKTVSVFAPTADLMSGLLNGRTSGDTEKRPEVSTEELPACISSSDLQELPAVDPGTRRVVDVEKPPTGSEAATSVDGGDISLEDIVSRVIDADYPATTALGHVTQSCRGVETVDGNMGVGQKRHRGDSQAGLHGPFVGFHMMAFTSTSAKAERRERRRSRSFATMGLGASGVSGEGQGRVCVIKRSKHLSTVVRPVLNMASSKMLSRSPDDLLVLHFFPMGMA